MENIVVTQVDLNSAVQALRGHWSQKMSQPSVMPVSKMELATPTSPPHLQLCLLTTLVSKLKRQLLPAVPLPVGAAGEKSYLQCSLISIVLVLPNLRLWLLAGGNGAFHGGSGLSWTCKGGSGLSWTCKSGSGLSWTCKGGSGLSWTCKASDIC